ncbi:MAG: ABC transporter ATP-binding protein [Nitrososphaerota archaeon]|nr:ABC transporter ATP-binding protein [Nitrososphaerota archaeon]
MQFDRYTKLASYAKKYKALVSVMVVSVVVLTILRVYVPILLGDAVTEIVARNSALTILTISLEIIGISALSSVFQFALGYGGQVLGQKIVYDIRNEIFVSIQNQSFSFHDKNETGQLMARATGDVEAVRRLLAFGSSQILGNIFIMGGVLVSIFILNIEAGLVVALVFPIVFYVAWRYSQSQAPHWRLARRHYGDINSALQQNISGLKIVRAFSAEQVEVNKFEKSNVEYRDDLINAASIRAFYTPLLTLIVTIAVGVVYLVLGNQVLGGAEQIGTLFAAATLIALLAGPVRFLGQLILFIQNGMVGFDRIAEILESNVEIKDAPDAKTLEPSKVVGNIRFEGVKFGYRKDRLILKGIDLEIKPGERIALLGSTGSGKTTLANLVPRFYDSTEGAVLIDGLNVKEVALKSLRSNIGIVSQDIFLFSATIEDNIAYGKSDATIEEVTAAARVACADEFIERFQERYDTLVGERGVTLSGGQKQRIAIARTIITNPKILILDDSLSSVDVETEYAIQEGLRAVVANRTTIIITQRLSTLSLADRIVVFDKGRIVEQGRHEELLALNGFYTRLYNAQFAPQSVDIPQVLLNATITDEEERSPQTRGRK